MLAITTCMICGRPITRQFMLCHQCERRWGLDIPVRLWPQWARTLWSDHKSQRRDELERLQREGDSARCIAYLNYHAYGDFNPDSCD